MEYKLSEIYEKKFIPSVPSSEKALPGQFGVFTNKDTHYILARD
jgi:hypothetical protein